MFDWFKSRFFNRESKKQVQVVKDVPLSVGYVTVEEIQEAFKEVVEGMPTRESLDKINTDESIIHWLLDHRKFWVQSESDENYYSMSIPDGLKFYILFDSKGPNVKVSNNEGWRVNLTKKNFQKWRGKYMAYHNGNLTDVEVI